MTAAQDYRRSHPGRRQLEIILSDQSYEANLMMEAIFHELRAPCLTIKDVADEPPLWHHS